MSLICQGTGDPPKKKELRFRLQFLFSAGAKFAPSSYSNQSSAALQLRRMPSFLKGFFPSKVVAADPTESQDLCSLCLEPQAAHEGITLPCSHCFHRHCIAELRSSASVASTRNSCPLCRAPLPLTGEQLLSKALSLVRKATACSSAVDEASTLGEALGEWASSALWHRPAP